MRGHSLPYSPSHPSLLSVALFLKAFKCSFSLQDIETVQTAWTLALKAFSTLALLTSNLAPQAFMLLMVKLQQVQGSVH